MNVQHIKSWRIVFFVLVILMHFACKKEYSCEDCNRANLPPIAVAGPDTSIILPTNSILLDGSASNDPDGTIEIWIWKKIEGPASYNIMYDTAARTIINNLDSGMYAFELSVTDNGGLVAKDTVSVSVYPAGITNRPPIANAGPDQTITLPTDSVVLDGSASSDPDNNISRFIWSKISGPNSFDISDISNVQTKVNMLIAGTYQFQLMVTDDGGLSNKDTVLIIVHSAVIVTHPPVANAGPDQVIHLPLSTVTLDGTASSDIDNNIATYKWVKISGPSSYVLSNSNSVSTQAQQLVEGVYLFELEVTDATGLSSMDTVQIWVRKATQTCTGCKIVFTSNRDGNAEIYTCEADGSNIVRLTNNAAVDDEPVWSPDHSKIAFSSNRSGNDELYIMNADGTNVMQKTFNRNYSKNPSWSPDGTKIAYSSLGNGSMGIAVVGVAGGTPQMLMQLPGYDAQPTWSPDGAKIAFVSDWAAFDFVYDIYQVNNDGTGFKGINDYNAYDYFDYTSPDWSPDGAKFAMIISRETGLNQYQTHVGTMDADGSNIKSIVSGAARWMRVSWSDDGKKILYTSATSGLDVAWVAADGSAKGTIVNNGWNADW